MLGIGSPGVGEQDSWVLVLFFSASADCFPSRPRRFIRDRRHPPIRGVASGELMKTALLLG